MIEASEKKKPAWNIKLSRLLLTGNYHNGLSRTVLFRGVLIFIESPQQGIFNKSLFHQVKHETRHLVWNEVLNVVRALEMCAFIRGNNDKSEGSLYEFLSRNLNKIKPISHTVARRCLRQMKTLRQVCPSISGSGLWGTYAGVYFTDQIEFFPYPAHKHIKIMHRLRFAIKKFPRLRG